MPHGEMTLREVDLDRDLTVAVDLVARSQQQAMGWVDMTSGFVVATMSGPEAVPSEFRLGVVGAEPVGLLLVEQDLPAREVFVDAFAAGDDAMHRLAQLVDAGLGAARRIAGPDHARAEAGIDPYVPGDALWQVSALHHPGDGRYLEVLTGLEFRPVRRFWRMSLDLVGWDREPSALPSGVTVRSAIDNADLRLVYAVEQASFADHFGSWMKPDFETWMTEISSRPGHDPDRWWIAALDGDPVGICLLDNSRAEQGEDHVRRIGVLPQARGRGIARWLLERAAHEAAARGQSALTLSVDGENSTGATRLYESVGFATRHVVDMWLRPLYLPAAASDDSR